MASGSSTSVAGGSAEMVLVTSAPGGHARTTGQVVVSPIQAMIDKAVDSSISSLSSSIERMVQEAVRKDSPSGTRVADTAIQGRSVSGGRSGEGVRAPIPSVVPLGSLPSSVALAGVPVLPQVAGIGSTSQRTLGVSLDTPMASITHMPGMDLSLSALARPSVQGDAIVVGSATPRFQGNSQRGSGGWSLWVWKSSCQQSWERPSRRYWMR